MEKQGFFVCVPYGFLSHAKYRKVINIIANKIQFITIDYALSQGK